MKSAAFFKRVSEMAIGEFTGKALNDALTGDRPLAELLKKFTSKKDSPQVELLLVFLELDEPDAKIMWQRHKKAIESGRENAFVTALAKAIPKKDGGQTDPEQAKRLFARFAKMEDPLFDQVIKELTYDPKTEAVNHFFSDLSKEMAELAKKIEKKNEEHDNTFFGRLAKKLIK